MTYSSAKTRILSTLFALILSASTAFSQQNTGQTCQFEPQILDLGERIITLRPNIHGFGSAEFGAESAYLMLRYRDMTLQDGVALFDRLHSDGARPPRYLNDLETAFSISRLDVQQVALRNATDPVELFLNGQFATTRAIILSDGGQTFFELVAQIKNDPALAESFKQSYRLGSSIPVTIRDQSDEFKLNFAHLAEINGEVVLAALVLANLSTLDNYASFLRRYADNKFVSRFANENIVFYMGLTLENSDGPTEILRQLSTSARHQEQMFFYTYKAGVLGREMEIFNILLNQTGRNEIANAARVYSSAIENGQLLPLDDPEAAWLFAHQMLIEELGMPALFHALSGFSQSTRIRHFAGNTLQTMDWVVAKSALAEYLRGEVDTLPPRPVILSESFDWDHWVDLAQRAGSWQDDIAEPLSLEDTKIAVELLYLRGEIDLAINLITSNLSAKHAAPIFRDLMKRLDLRCSAFTSYPGKALLLGGFTLYRFEP